MTLIRQPGVLALTTALLLCSSIHGAGDDDFRPMFTDAALSGWVRTNTPEQTWRFEDGVLYCTGKPIGEIRTGKMYQNFVMELEWRHMVPRGNAGIFVWADDITARGVPFHRGIEVQVLENDYGNTRSHTTHGDIFPIHGATMTPINGRGGSRAFPIENRSNPSPEWNHYRIECRDGEISLAVNGKIVTRGKDCVPRKGYICLESEGGVVEYRNVRIKELPGAALPVEQIAIANRGYQSLYTGLNLEGWKTDDATDWKVKDWVLAYEGGDDQPGLLETAQRFDSASFLFDMRLKDSDSRLAVAIGPGRQIDLNDPDYAMHFEKQGRWNRIEMSAVGDQYKLTINGQSVAPVPKSDASAALSLRPTGPVDFANLYVAD